MITAFVTFVAVSFFVAIVASVASSVASPRAFA